MTAARRERAWQPGWRPVWRSLLEGALFGGLLATAVIGLAVVVDLSSEAERLGEQVGPEVLVGFAFGAFFGFVPGALVGMLLGLACLLLFTVATFLFGRGRARWVAIDSVVLTVTAVASIHVFGGGADVWFLHLSALAAALAALLRMRAVARGPRPHGLDAATAARLSRAFDDGP